MILRAPNQMFFVEKNVKVHIANHICRLASFSATILLLPNMIFTFTDISLEEIFTSQLTNNNKKKLSNNI